MNIFAYRFLKKNNFPDEIFHVQDGGWLVSLSFNISETKHVIKNLITNLTFTSEVLIDKP